MIRILRASLLFWVLLVILAPVVQAQAGKRVHVLTLQGVINPVNAGYVSRAITEANRVGASTIVIKLDTPGGLDSSMREIIQAIVNSQAPVIVWVAPSGARAASAGMFIMMAAHIAAMAPDSAIGAAHPVGSGGDEIQGDLRDKVTNDAVAYVRDLAERRGRNADWAEQAVRTSISASSAEAERQRVIDLVAPDLTALLHQSDGRAVTTPSGRVTIQTADATIVEDGMTVLERFLLVLTDPTIAAFLLGLAGVALYFEFANPGAILPGVVGGIALLLALYGLGTLPVNYAALALVAFGFILFFFEAQTPSHGVLGVGGLVSIAVGLVMLVNSSAPYLQVSRPAIAGLVLGLGAMLTAMTVLAIRTRNRKVVTGKEGLLGKVGTVRQPLAPRGLVFVDGELWEAVAEEAIPVGGAVEIIGVNGLTLQVRAASAATA